MSNLVSYWRASVKKITKWVIMLESDVLRSRANELIKRDARITASKILNELNKGRVHEGKPDSKMGDRQARPHTEVRN